MATYVLLHGAYQGGWIWQPIATRLRQRLPLDGGSTPFHGGPSCAQLGCARGVRAVDHTPRSAAGRTHGTAGSAHPPH